MKRLKEYSSISRLKWCHWNCNGISSLVSAEDAAVLWCVAKHFKLLMSYMWLGITKLWIFLLYCILEPHLWGISKKHASPSSFLVIKIFILVQKPPNQFDLEIKLIWSLWLGFIPDSQELCTFDYPIPFSSPLYLFFLNCCLNRILIFGFFAITFFVSFCQRWYQYSYFC